MSRVPPAAGTNATADGTMPLTRAAQRSEGNERITHGRCFRTHAGRRHGARSLFIFIEEEGRVVRRCKGLPPVHTVQLLDRLIEVGTGRTLPVRAEEQAEM